MSWIDLTLGVDENIVTWDNDSSFYKRTTSAINNGDSCNELRIHIGSHTGTHIDAPYHFNNDGKKVNELDLNILVGKCYVAEIYGTEIITADDIKRNVPEGTKRLLLKTDNTKIGYERKFRTDFCGIDVSAVSYMRENGIKLLGNDYLSIAKYEFTGDVHRAFLKCNDNIALEGLVMNDVSSGWYELCCLPMKIIGADGAPARVIVKRI